MGSYIPTTKRGSGDINRNKRSGCLQKSINIKHLNYYTEWINWYPGPCRDPGISPSQESGCQHPLRLLPPWMWTTPQRSWSGCCLVAGWQHSPPDIEAAASFTWSFLWTFRNFLFRWNLLGKQIRLFKKSRCAGLMQESNWH
jgi:hypothetical protein